MINPKESPLCGMCSRVVNCPCECHISDITKGFHENVFSGMTSIKVRKEGKGPERGDYVLMRMGKMPKSLKYRIREPFKRFL